MTHEALVVTIEGDYAELRRKDLDCAACSNELCSPKNRHTRAIVSSGLDVRVDDWVELSYSTAGALLDAVILLGIPAAGFVLGYVFAPAVGEALATNASDPTTGAVFFQNDVGRAVLGLVGLALGAVVPILRRRGNADAGLPTVTRVIRRRPQHSRTPHQTVLQPGS